MEPRIIDSETPLKETDLDAVEERLSLDFPDSYRAWLLRHNGGHPVPDKFNLMGDDEAFSSVAWFLAVYDGQFENFEHTYRLFKVINERLPINLVPIARDPGGNLICLSFDGSDKGKVYFWDHEEEADNGEPVTYENCHLIAHSFQEFINDLHD